jgi:hypothetical protein
VGIKLKVAKSSKYETKQGKKKLQEKSASIFDILK